MRHWRRTLGSRGQTTVEYTLICAVILAVLILAIGGPAGQSIGNSIKTMFERLASWLNGAVTHVTTNL